MSLRREKAVCHWTRPDRAESDVLEVTMKIVVLGSRGTENQRYRSKFNAPTARGGRGEVAFVGRRGEAIAFVGRPSLPPGGGNYQLRLARWWLWSLHDAFREDEAANRPAEAPSWELPPPRDMFGRLRRLPAPPTLAQQIRQLRTRSRPAPR
jgi:hypothetical protein